MERESATVRPMEVSMKMIGGPGGELGEQVGCAAGAEGCLGTLTAEGSGEVGGFALLEENDADEEERNDNVQDNEKNDHRSCL